jgi:hypothetical protein
MDSDQDFAAFLREWTSERIWPMDDFLDPLDRQFIAERRAVELTELAKENGFDDNLMGVARSYGDVVGYVKHLMWEADFDAAPSPDPK